MTQTAPNVMVHQMLGTDGGKDSGRMYRLLSSCVEHLGSKLLVRALRIDDHVQVNKPDHRI